MTFISEAHLIRWIRYRVNGCAAGLVETGCLDPGDAYVMPLSSLSYWQYSRS